MINAVQTRSKDMKSPSENEAFDKVKDQIGFCGIWCGSCVVGNGILRELTRRYEEVIKAYGVEKWGPQDFDYKEFFRGLASIQSMPLCSGCLKGDGRENCEMRACASAKDLHDCSECREIASCVHGEIVQKMRSGALQAGLYVKTEDVDRQELVGKWTTELKGTWPGAFYS
jgi:hypothetical protein